MKKLDVPVGYSSNGRDAQVMVMAATLGACFLEINLTLDRSLPGPDQPGSFEPKEFAELVRQIRQVPILLGFAAKGPTPAEKKYMPLVRKSLVAAHDIKKGEAFTKENLEIKRPGTGLAPKQYTKMLGKKAKHNFARDSLIR